MNLLVKTAHYKTDCPVNMAYFRSRIRTFWVQERHHVSLLNRLFFIYGGLRSCFFERLLLPPVRGARWQKNNDEEKPISREYCINVAPDIFGRKRSTANGCCFRQLFLHMECRDKKMVWTAVQPRMSVRSRWVTRPTGWNQFQLRYLV